MRLLSLSVPTFILLLSINSPAFSKQQVSVIGDGSYFPYSYLEGGENKGIYHDILTEAFSKMEGYEVTIKLQPWKRGLNDLKTGKVFGLYPPYYRPKSRPWINPYSTSILDEVVVVVCNKDRVAGKKFVKFPQDYAGVSFGNNSGYQSGGKEFMDMVASGAISMTETKDTSSNLKKLKHGRVDCYINDRLAILTEAKKMGGADWFIETSIIATEQGYLGFSKGTDNFPYTDDFVKAFNSIISEMKSSGRIEEIVSEFLK